MRLSTENQEVSAKSEMRQNIRAGNRTEPEPNRTEPL